mmetsp:Transcript_31289/g.65436  ORF Transcript_31289/g.65436 Transcript_31289/m.65436 type:complete len:143 (+) Transcript_31289:360-788(+)
MPTASSAVTSTSKSPMEESADALAGVEGAFMTGGSKRKAPSSSSSSTSSSSSSSLELLEGKRLPSYLRGLPPRLPSLGYFGSPSHLDYARSTSTSNCDFSVGNSCCPDNLDCCEGAEEATRWNRTIASAARRVRLSFAAEEE